MLVWLLFFVSVSVGQSFLLGKVVWNSGQWVMFHTNATDPVVAIQWKDTWVYRRPPAIPQVPCRDHQPLRMSCDVPFYGQLLNFSVVMSPIQQAHFAFPWLEWQNRWYAFEEPVFQLTWQKDSWIINGLSLPWPFSHEETAQWCELQVHRATQWLYPNIPGCAYTLSIGPWRDLELSLLTLDWIDFRDQDFVTLSAPALFDNGSVGVSAIRLFRA